MKYAAWLLVAAFVGLLIVSVGCTDVGNVTAVPPIADGACSNPPGVNNRFVDCGNGMVTDTTTHLIWLKNANCFLYTRDWDAAMASAVSLKSGDCGLTDNSSAGSWRLPSLECPSGASCLLTTPPTGEFATIFASSCGAPYILNTAGTGCWTEGNPFSGVQPGIFWSSTTGANDPGLAWGVNLSAGYVFSFNKSLTHYVWPVRDGY